MKASLASTSLFALVLALLLSLGFVTVSPTAAQDHVVAPSDIQKDLAGSSAARQKNETQLQDFISSPEAQQALKSAHIDANRVKNAIPSLDDDELAQLSQRSQKAQQDFAAGRMSDRDLIIILIAIVALILIIVAVR